MKSNDRLGWFITFILLSAAPKKRAVAVGKFTPIQPAIPDLLPLTRFLKNALDRVRAHESLLSRRRVQVELVFRIGRPEQASGEKEINMNRSLTSIQSTGTARAHITGLALTFLFLLATAFIAPSAAWADNLVQNGGFETGDFSGWTVTGDVQGAQVVSGGGSNSGCCFAKFNPGSDYVYLSQTISTPHTPGSSQLYDLLFFWKLVDLPPTDFQVFWGGQLVADFQNTGSQQWTQFQLDGLTATRQETQLTFGFKVSDGQSYFGLDDVSVSQQTPEPSSLMLLGSGILSAAAAIRKTLRGIRK